MRKKPTFAATERRVRKSLTKTQGSWLDDPFGIGKTRRQTEALTRDMKNIRREIDKLAREFRALRTRLASL